MNNNTNNYGQENAASDMNRNANYGDSFGASSYDAGRYDTGDSGIHGMGSGIRSVGSSILRNLAGNSWEMNQVEEEVNAEQRGRIAVVGRNEEELRTLVARLRQEPTQPAINAAIQNEGLFTLMDLAFTAPTVDASDVDDTDAGDPSWDNWLDESPLSDEQLVTVASDADCILYVFCATVADGSVSAWQPEDARWIHRLRATGTPILAVGLRNGDFAADNDAAVKLRAALRQRLSLQLVYMTDDYVTDDTALNGGQPIVPGSHQINDEVLTLVKTILSIRSRLAIPLAQDVPSCRQYIARKITRTGAWMTTLLGAEPIPLLDLPLHIATHWRVALQVASAYGRPGLDYRSREMMGTVLLNLGVRYAAQQLLKLIPIIGWAGSALLSGASTLMLGEALIRIYEQEPIIDFKKRQQASRESVERASEMASGLVNEGTGSLRRHARGLKGSVQAGFQTGVRTYRETVKPEPGDVELSDVEQIDIQNRDVHYTTGSTNNAGDFTEPPFEPDEF